MKIGVRAHDYGKMEIEELARVLKDEGYQAAQVAMPKAFCGIECYEDITPKHLERIRSSFEENGIDIPVLGYYMDLGNPDEEIRANAVKTLKQCLVYGREIGAKMIGTETACKCLSREEKEQWRPFMMDSIKRIMEEAVRLDVKLAIEPVQWHPLENVERVLDVMDEIGDEEHLRMIFDASNVLDAVNCTNQKKYWSDWLEQTGKYIETMHIKDFKVDAAGQYCPTLLGEGVIQYETISRWLHANRPDMYLLREEMNPAAAQRELAFLRKL